MEKNSNFNSKRFMILLITICLLFLVIVLKAFEYLPENDTRNRSISSINKVIDSEEQFDESSGANLTDIAASKKTLNISLPKQYDDVSFLEQNEQQNAQNTMSTETPKFEEIENPEAAAKQNDDTSTKTAELTPEEQFIKIMAAARQYKRSQQYAEAVDEYKKIQLITQDKDSVAQSYEEIASIYAAARKYGTALSYATKAYNMSPNSNREILLARLYYKTGDINKATSRVNNVLKREFSEDR